MNDDDQQKQQQETRLYCISDDIEEIDKDNTISSSRVKNLCHQVREHSGIFYMLIAHFIFTCCTFSLKLIPADIFDIMIIRLLIPTTAYGVFARFYKHYDIFNTNGQPLACALNIFMSSSTSLTYLTAFYFLPLSDLNTIKYTYIVWAAILSVLFLKDRFKITNGISLFLTLFGIIFATKPHFFIQKLTHLFNPTSIIVSNTTTITMIANVTTSPYYYLGIFLASISALCKAIQMIARKHLVTTKQPISVMNFHFTISPLILSIIYSIVRRFWQPGPYPWKWMFTAGVIIGFFQLLSNILATKALKRENVQLLTVLGSIEILYSVLLQYIFFRQTKSWLFYLGALFVVIATTILSIDRYLENKRERQKKTMNNEKH